MLMIVLIVYGQYNKISSSKIISVLLRVHCIFVSLLIIVPLVLLYFFELSQWHSTISLLLSVVEIQFLFFVFQITSQVGLYKYVSNIIMYDSLLGSLKHKKIAIVPSAVVFFMAITCLTLAKFIFDLFFSPLWVSFFLENKYYASILFIGKHLTVYSLHLTTCTIVYVLALLHHRLMQLRKTLERNTVPVNIVSKEEALPKLRVARRCLLYYNNLLDAYDEVDSTVQFKVSNQHTRHHFKNSVLKNRTFTDEYYQYCDINPLVR